MYTIYFVVVVIVTLVLRRHGHRQRVAIFHHENRLRKMAPAVRGIGRLSRKREIYPPTAIIITWTETSKSHEITRPISCLRPLYRNIERSAPVWLMGRLASRRERNTLRRGIPKSRKSATGFVIFSRPNRWGKLPFSDRVSFAPRSQTLIKRNARKRKMQKMYDRLFLICDDATTRIAITWLPREAGRRQPLRLFSVASHRLVDPNWTERQRPATVQTATNLWNSMEGALQSTSVSQQLARLYAPKTVRRPTGSSMEIEPPQPDRPSRKM